MILWGGFFFPESFDPPGFLDIVFSCLQYKESADGVLFCANMVISGGYADQVSLFACLDVIREALAKHCDTLPSSHLQVRPPHTRAT